MLTERLTQRIEASAVKRLEFKTEIVETDGGFEHRNRRRTYPKAEWDITVPPQNRDTSDYLATRALFLAAAGAWETWLLHDHDDCSALLSWFGVGDGADTTFQLSKRYTVGGQTYDRKITRAISPISVYKDGVLQTVTTHYTVDYTTGIVTFVTAPAVGVVLTWSGDFDVPVRFKDDVLELAGLGNKATIGFTAREVYE